MFLADKQRWGIRRAQNVFTCVGDIQFNPSPVRVTSFLKDTLHYSLVHLFWKVEWFVSFPPSVSEGIPPFSLKCSIMGLA